MKVFYSICVYAIIIFCFNGCTKDPVKHKEVALDDGYAISFNWLESNIVTSAKNQNPLGSCAVLQQ